MDPDPINFNPISLYIKHTYTLYTHTHTHTNTHTHTHTHTCTHNCSPLNLSLVTGRHLSRDRGQALHQSSQLYAAKICIVYGDYSLYRYSPWLVVQLYWNVMDKPFQRGIVQFCSKFWDTQYNCATYQREYLYNE